MAQYKAIRFLIKVRWLLMLAGISLMIYYLYGEQSISSKVLFTGILLNLVALLGIAANIIKLTNIPTEMTELR